MIKEILIIEGKSDNNKLKEVLGEVDTIITNGSEVSMETIELIKEAAKTRGVILFLDPDGPGKLIRAKIEQHVPNCKHAFIDKKDAISKNRKKVGIEHASAEVIINALESVYEICDNHISINPIDIHRLGLTGKSNSSELRFKVAGLLKIGHPNTKQFIKRLQMFNISIEKVEEVIKKLGD